MTRKKTWLKLALILLVVFGAAGAFFGWYKFFREVPQAPFASGEMRFGFTHGRGVNQQGIVQALFLEHFQRDAPHERVVFDQEKARGHELSSRRPDG